MRELVFFFAGVYFGVCVVIWILFLRKARREDRLVEALAEELRNPEPWIDPVLRVEYDDGTVMVALTLWEWIGRAIVLHELPPATLDEVRVFLDGTEVIREPD